MPKNKIKLIINPNADLGRAWRVAADLRPLVDQFGGADWTGTVYPTHATELARQAGEEGYKLVIAAGGDGTAHEVINGLMQLPAERRPRFGIVPLGTGNDFAHAIGVQSPAEVALRQVFNGQPKPIDIGVLRDNLGRTEYWDNTVGIGFDATATIHSRKYAYMRGFIVYFLAVLQTILLNHDAPKLQIESDLENWTEETLMLVMCNGPREGGGFHVAPEAQVNDGVLHYASVRRVSRAMMLRLLPEVMNGTHGRFSQVRMGQFHSMQINSDRPLTIHTDGEIYAGFGVDVHQVSLEILPEALEVMV
jgi:YegS/Rv2252/BmrU family lipid kinase